MQLNGSFQIMSIQQTLKRYKQAREEKNKEETFSLTLSQHAHGQTLHKAARLARLASPLGDLALVGGWTAVLDVA